MTIDPRTLKNAYEAALAERRQAHEDLTALLGPDQNHIGSEGSAHRFAYEAALGRLETAEYHLTAARNAYNAYLGEQNARDRARGAS